MIETWMKLMGNSEHMGRVRSLFRTSIGKRADSSIDLCVKRNVKVYLLCEKVHGI